MQLFSLQGQIMLLIFMVESREIRTHCQVQVYLSCVVQATQILLESDNYSSQSEAQTL